jgi:hypothetical protein
MISFARQAHQYTYSTANVTVSYEKGFSIINTLNKFRSAFQACDMIY